MLTLLSPAKNLDFERNRNDVERTEPRLSADTATLIKRTKKLSRAKIRKLMDLSDDLAELNYERFQALAKDPDPNTTQPAILAFNGDVYRGLDAMTMDGTTLEFAQDHVRILSGLYGILRPFDGIHPYRLEMGTRLDTDRGTNLYTFWGTKLAELLNEDCEARGVTTILNLASQEYSKAVDRKALNGTLIDVTFKERKNGKSKVISFYAKYARGRMARWVCDNKITSPVDLQAFNLDDYEIDPSESSETSLVFERPQPEPKS